MQDKIVRLEHHYDDGYGTVYCFGQKNMSLDEFHVYLKQWSKNKESSLFDINSTDSLIKFLNSEIKLYSNTDKDYWEIDSGKISWDNWIELTRNFYEEPLIDYSGWGENAGNNVDELRIFVNGELVATF